LLLIAVCLGFGIFARNLPLYLVGDPLLGFRRKWRWRSSRGGSGLCLRGDLGVLRRSQRGRDKVVG
jgi:hypothetical protein